MITDRFLRRLFQFARSVHYVDDATLERIERTFYDYLTKGLNSCYYEVCVDAPPFEKDSSVDQPNLQVLWCFTRDRRSNLIQLIADDAKSLYSQKAYAFCRRQPLWITARQPNAYLRTCKLREDLVIEFTKEAEPPGYRDYDDHGNARTSVLLPMVYEKQYIGVMDVEFARLIPYGRDVREHLKILCDSVAIIIGRYRSTQQSAADTREAFADLRQDLRFEEECGLPNEKDQLFLSYPERADQTVVGELKRVLGSDKYKEWIKVEDWKVAARPGPITPQIVDSIRASRFGICYFSEREEGDERAGARFKDNPNVLFEAGMFHVLRHNRGDSLQGWLPIRESAELTGEVPFNFAGDRVLIVPRNDRGELVRELFLENLGRHLDRLFES